MARRDFIEDWRGRYKYVEVSRNDGSLRRRFAYREEEYEADEYFAYLQSLDNQVSLLDAQQKTAMSQAALLEEMRRKNNLEQNRYEQAGRLPQYPMRPPFPPQPKIDPAYLEWQQFQKEKQMRDPEFLAWKLKKQQKEAQERAQRNWEATWNSLDNEQRLNKALQSVKIGTRFTSEETSPYTFDNVTIGLTTIYDLFYKYPYTVQRGTSPEKCCLSFSIPCPDSSIITATDIDQDGIIDHVNVIVVNPDVLNLFPELRKHGLDCTMTPERIDAFAKSFGWLQDGIRNWFSGQICSFCIYTDPRNSVRSFWFNLSKPMCWIHQSGAEGKIKGYRSIPPDDTLSCRLRNEEEEKKVEEELRKADAEREKNERMALENLILSGADLPVDTLLKAVERTQNREVLNRLAENPSVQVRRSVARKPMQLDEDTLDRLSHEKDINLLKSLASRADISPSIIHRLAGVESSGVRKALAKNPLTPPDVLSEIQKSGSAEVQKALLTNNNTTAETACKARKYLDKKKAAHSGGCFIATACYGDYDAPEVRILRQWRDDILLESFPGRLFIQIYYIVSPPMARILKRTGKLREYIRRNLLQPIVAKVSSRYGFQ